MFMEAEIKMETNVKANPKPAPRENVLYVSCLIIMSICTLIGIAGLVFLFGEII